MATEVRLDFDDQLERYSIEWIHHGRWCQGRRLVGTLLSDMPLVKKKMFSTEGEHRLALAAQAGAGLRKSSCERRSPQL